MRHHHATIASAHVQGHAIPIHLPFAIATETLPAADILTLTVIDNEGRCGLGEASPFPSLTHDDIRSSETLLRELSHHLSRTGSVPQALAWLYQESPGLKARSVTAYVAAETALLDLLARQHAVPMALLFGTAFLPHIETDITLPILPSDGIERFWQLFGDSGFAVIKIKVSGQVAQDVAMVQHLRRLAGERVTITLDGNQGFTAATALQLIHALATQGIRPAFFEQPLARDDHQGSIQLAAASPIPICLDESVTSAAEAMAAVREKRGHMLNIKIMKSGVSEAQRMIQVALAAGWPLMIGGMLESEIAMATSLQLAAGTGAITHFDLDTPFFFTRSLTQGHPWQARRAHLLVPYTEGHGLQSLG